jgi:hypothetical protein
MKKTYRIFISSTVKDKENLRNKVEKHIISKYDFPIKSEYFRGAGNDSPLPILMQKIEESDGIIFILGHKYGEIIAKKRISKCPITKKYKSLKCNCKAQECNLSFVEFEYRYALLKNKPLVILYDNCNSEITEPEQDYFINELKNLGNVSEYIGTTFENELTKSYDALIKKIKTNEDNRIDFYGLIPYKEFAKLEPLEIKGTYINQKELLKSLKQDSIYELSKNNELIIRVLTMRGVSFLPNGPWYRYFESKAKHVSKEIVWGYPNEAFAKHRFEEVEGNGILTNEQDMSKYWDERKKQELPNIYSNYIHTEPDIPFRMVFIGNYLFLSSYRKKWLRSSPVIQIHRESPLYMLCEKYYDSIQKDIINNE